MAKMFPENATLRKLLTQKRARHTLAVVGGVLVHLSLGTLYTFGNIIPYVASYARLRSGPATLRYRHTVWGFALANIGFGCAMFLGGLLQRKIGPRWTTAIGGITMSCGVALSYFAVQDSFYWFMITHGLMCGIGIGIAYASPLQVSIQWMPKRRGLASGLIVTGFGGGAFIFDQVQSAYLNPENLPPVNAMYLNATDLQGSGETYFNEASILDRVPSMFLLLGGIYVCMQIVGSLLLFSPISDKPVAGTCMESRSLVAASDVCSEASDNEFSEKQCATSSHDGNRGNFASVMPLQMIRTRTFVTLWFMYACNQLVAQFVSTLYKAFGLSFVADDHALTWLGMLAAVFNASGRILWGLLADRFSFKAAMLGLCGSMAVLMATLYFTQYVAKEVFYTWVCLIFLCFSGNFSLFPTAIAEKFGPEHLAVNYGLLFTGTIVAGFIGAILADNLPSLLAVFSVCSALSAVSFVLLLTLNWKSS